MRRLGIPQKLVLILVSGVGLTAPLAFWMLAPWTPRTWLADRLYVELGGGQDEELDLPAKQLAGLGEAGWEALVRGLQHPRPGVRSAAERAIRELIDSWESLPPASSAAHVAALARLLANALPTADANALHVSANLAERFVGWPDGGSDSIQLVYDCEQVLRAARQTGWPATNMPEPAPEPPAVTSAMTRSPSHSLPSFPGKAGAAENTPAATPPDPLEFTATTPAESSEMIGDSSSLGLQSVFSFIPASGQNSDPSIAETTPEESADPETTVGSPPDWPRLGVHEVLRLWRDPSLAAEAEAELRARRFDSLNLRVARIAADVDPATRLKLIYLVPQLAGVNSVNWLLVLAQDESPRVRSAAVGMLSTAPDPRIQQQLQKLEETEADPAVRAAIRKSRSLQ